MNSGNPPKDSSEPFSWKLRPTPGMNSGQPPTSPQKDSGEPVSWKLRPTLQLKIKDNSSTEN